MTTENATDQSRTLDTSPRKYIIAGLLIIFVFFGGLVAWGAFFPFQGAVIAPGTVKVSGERKTVQHKEGGMIDEILVDEGDLVEQGQVLVKLKDSQVRSSVDLLQGRKWSKMAQAARLRAESRLATSMEWPESLLEQKDNPEVAQAMEQERSVFRSRRKNMLGRISQHESQIEQLRNRIDGAREELAAQEEIIDNLQQELQTKQALAEDDYMGKLELLKLQRQLSERRGRLGKLKQTIAEHRQRIEELRLNIATIRNKYQERAVSKLNEVQNTLFEVRQRIRPQLDAQKRLKIRAPIQGEVINLRVSSEDSGVIQPGDPLLDIVPTNATLIVESRVRLQDITDVRKGQQTKVQLSAYNRRTTPPIPGEVIYVSPDQITERTPRGEQSFYKARIEVDREALKEHNAYLAPGMPATCYITTDKRTVLGYLLDPILQIADKAMRES